MCVCVLREDPNVNNYGDFIERIFILFRFVLCVCAVLRFFNRMFKIRTDTWACGAYNSTFYFISVFFIPFSFFSSAICLNLKVF